MLPVDSRNCRHHSVCWRCGSERGVCSYMLDKRSSGSESEVLLSELRVGMSRQSQILSLDTYIIHILQTCQGLVTSYPHTQPYQSHQTFYHDLHPFFALHLDPSAGDSRMSGYEARSIAGSGTRPTSWVIRLPLSKGQAFGTVVSSCCSLTSYTLFQKLAHLDIVSKLWSAAPWSTSDLAQFHWKECSVPP